VDASRADTFADNVSILVALSSAQAHRVAKAPNNEEANPPPAEPPLATVCAAATVALARSHDTFIGAD